MSILRIGLEEVVSELQGLFRRGTTPMVLFNEEDNTVEMRWVEGEEVTSVEIRVVNAYFFDRSNMEMLWQHRWTSDE